MNKIIFTKIAHLSELFLVAKEVLKFVSENKIKNNNQACIISLKGNLGAGKTTFSQALAKELGIEENITSPTFVIQKKYEIKNKENETRDLQSFKTLIHVDAYRLEGNIEYIQREISLLKLNEEFKDPSNLILFEWPERLYNFIPPHFELSISHSDQPVDKAEDNHILDQTAQTTQITTEKRVFELCYVE